MRNYKLKKIIIEIIVILLTILVGYFYSITDVKTFQYYKKIDDSKWEYTNLLKENSISSSFTANEATISGIQIKIKKNENNKNDKVLIELIDKDGKIISKGEKLFSEIKSDRFNKILFINKTNTSLNEKYTIKIYLSKNSESSIDIATYEMDGDRSYTINNEVKNGFIVYRTICHRFNIETFIMFILFIGFISMFLRFLFKLFRA